MIRTVMILGAGEGQLNFLKICKQHGYRVIVVSIQGNYPCFKYADQSYYIDTKNKEEILKIAIKEKIDAITTDQTDVSVYSVAYIADKLGLKGIGIDTALKFTNKYEMRKSAKKAGIAIPEFQKVYSLDDALDFAHQIGYPVILKPVDSSGSRGVFKVDSDLTMKYAFPLSLKKTLLNYLIVEKFIIGKEYLADGFAMDYKYITLDVGDKEYFNIPNVFISKTCIFSSIKNLENNEFKLVKKTNDLLINAFNLPFGITHAEYIYCYEDQQVYLVECAARGGGVYLSSDLTPLASGFDTNTALIEYLVEDKKIFPNIDNLLKNVSAWICFGFPKGTIKKIMGKEDVLRLKGVHKFITDRFFVGMKTNEITDDTDKYGPILIVCNNRNSCKKLINKIKQTFSVSIQTESGEKGLIW